MVLMRVALVITGIAAQVLGLVTACTITDHVFAIVFLAVPILLVGGALWLGPKLSRRQGRHGEAAVLVVALALLAAATAWMLKTVVSPAERGTAAGNPPPFAPR